MYNRFILLYINVLDTTVITTLHLESADHILAVCIALLFSGSKVHTPITSCHTYHTVLLVRCLSVSPVCLSRSCTVAGQCWTNEYEIWHAGGPQPWPHCVTWGLSSPSPK